MNIFVFAIYEDAAIYKPGNEACKNQYGDEIWQGQDDGFKRILIKVSCGITWIDI